MRNNRETSFSFPLPNFIHFDMRADTFCHCLSTYHSVVDSEPLLIMVDQILHCLNVLAVKTAIATKDSNKIPTDLTSSRHSNIASSD